MLIVQIRVWHIFFNIQIDGLSIWHALDRRGAYNILVEENLVEGDDLEDLGVYIRIILKWSLNKSE